MVFAYFKNRFLPEEECHVSIADRSFRFGDGIFDTCIIANGRIYDFASHKARLEDGLKATRITLDTSKFESICHELIEKNNVQFGYVRIIISRGEGLGAVGYLPKNSEPTLLIQTSEKPYPAFAPITLWISSYKACSQVPSKTNSALVYTLAMMEANEKSFDNALMLDESGHICETASGNIFWVKDSVLYTPSADLPLVPGTKRKKVLELWEGDKREGRFTIDALQQADEIFMTNIATITAPVVRIEPLGISRPVGKMTQRVRELLDRDILGDSA